MANIPDAINESGSDYELIQPGLGRLEEGSSQRRMPYLPQHLRFPPTHPPPPRPVTRLSKRRERNYAGLLSRRQSQAEYATPSAPAPRDMHVRDERPTHLRYDAFFQGSQQEEDESGEQSLIPELGHSGGEHRECCSCGWVTVKSILLCILVVITLLASLAALGLGLYCVFHHQDSSHFTQCMTTVTMAPSESPCTPTLDNPQCTTNCLPTNITGYTSPRFHCEATYKEPAEPQSHKHLYNNTLYLGDDSAYCVCQFSGPGGSVFPYEMCVVIGEYCMDSQDNNTLSHTVL